MPCFFGLTGFIWIYVEYMSELPPFRGAAQSYSELLGEGEMGRSMESLST